MSALFEVYRPDGKLHISSNYPTYQFVKKIRGQGNFFDTSGQQYSDHVLVAFTEVNSRAAFSSYRFTKGRENGWGDLQDPPTNATLSLYSGTLVDAYVFDIVLTPSSSNVGLQVFKQDGTVTFDSSRPIMRVLDLIQIGTPNASHSWTVIKNGLNYGGDAMYFSKTYNGHGRIGVLPLKDRMWEETDIYDQYFCATWHKCFGNRYEVTEIDSEYGVDNRYPVYASSLEFAALIIGLDHISA